MSPQLVGILAAIAAAQARIEAMRLANAQIDLQAYPPRYDEAQFLQEAGYLDMLSNDARNLPS